MARKEKNLREEEEFSFDDILEEIQSISNEIECGPYRVKELTMRHQRKNIAASMEPVEAPLRTIRLFNEYIRENVESNEAFGDICDIVDVSDRPYLVTLLRQVTFGNEYKVGDKIYHTYEVKDSDFENEEKTLSFNCGALTITLEYPSLTKDDAINEQLSNALTPFKKRKLNEDDYGKIGDIYSVHEIMKYIAIIEKDGREILFDTLSISNRKKFIDGLQLKYIEIISDFMSKIKEHETKCFTAYNPADKEDTIEIDLNSIFSAKSIS